MARPDPRAPLQQDECKMKVSRELYYLHLDLRAYKEKTDVRKNFEKGRTDRTRSWTWSKSS